MSAHRSEPFITEMNDRMAAWHRCQARAASPNPSSSYRNPNPYCETSTLAYTTYIYLTNKNAVELSLSFNFRCLVDLYLFVCLVGALFLGSLYF